MGTDTAINEKKMNNQANITAKKIKLVVTSGYTTAWWELAEFEVNGTIIE